MSTNRIRETLVAERLKRDWSQQQVANEIVRQGSTESFTDQGVAYWETGTIPPIDGIRGWAKALGHELVVDLVPDGEGYVSAPIRRDLEPLARRMSRGLPEQDVELVERMVRALARLPRETEHGSRHRRFMLDDIERAEREIDLATTNRAQLNPADRDDE